MTNTRTLIRCFKCHTSTLDGTLDGKAVCWHHPYWGVVEGPPDPPPTPPSSPSSDSGLLKGFLSILGVCLWIFVLASWPWGALPLTITCLYLVVISD